MTTSSIDETIPAAKIVTMGESGVGKSSLLSVYTKGEISNNPMPTIGVEFQCKVFELKDGSKVKFQLYDTAGQEKYRSIVANYLRKALGCLLVYDITKRSTFEQCKQFMTDIRQIAEPDCVILLVGNKNDLQDQRQVEMDEAKRFATENKMYFIETSALTKYKVTEAFEQLFECKF